MHVKSDYGLPLFLQDKFFFLAHFPVQTFFCVIKILLRLRDVNVRSENWYINAAATVDAKACSIKGFYSNQLAYFLTSAQRNFADSYVPVFSNPFKTPLSNKDP
jgi:hypothetical protein